jgi:hypothetical protein
LSVMGVSVAAMKLEMMTEEDVELRVRQETDPQMMAELGGPGRGKPSSGRMRSRWLWPPREGAGR